MSLFLPVFRLLNDASVRYIVVGGVATILHGYVRLTMDLDLVLDLHAEQARKAISALTAGGFWPQAPVDPMQFADATERERWIAEKHMEVFSLANPRVPGITVDLFARCPIPFEDLWSHSVLMDLEGVTVRVCSLDDLVELKHRSGRPKDLADHRNPDSTPDRFWPVTFADVGEAQLRAALAAAPAQRLLWAEQLIEFARAAEAARCNRALRSEEHHG
jgi:hypothetical protein